MTEIEKTRRHVARMQIMLAPLPVVRVHPHTYPWAGRLMEEVADAVRTPSSRLTRYDTDIPEEE
jgi:hypothetical protein